MGYFFVDKRNIKDNIITIKGSDFKHIKDVLRSKVGNTIVVVTGNGEEYHSVITGIKHNFITAKITRITRKTNESLVYVSIAIAPPKGRRMEWFVEKATELGVKEIIPVITKRSVVFPGSARLQRWKRIAISAIKQSERSVMPGISTFVSFEELLSLSNNYFLKFIAYENESKDTIEKYLQGEKREKILALIGPEGGFEDYEVDAAKKEGFLPVTLGITKLRTESAGIVALSRILACG